MNLKAAEKKGHLKSADKKKEPHEYIPGVNRS